MGRGGWPNNLFLTPKGQPIVAMGYAPRDAFQEAAAGLAQDWHNPEGRAAMIEQAASVSEYVRLVSGTRGDRRRNRRQHDRTRPCKRWSRTMTVFRADSARGRNSPTSQPCDSCSTATSARATRPRFRRRSRRCARWRRAASTTTSGGGFHRYAVDPNWRTPHFEKDALQPGPAVPAFCEAYRRTRPARPRRARTLDYVLRDMTAPMARSTPPRMPTAAMHGGELEEGAFYVVDARS